MEFYHDILENLLDKLIDYRGKTPKKTLSGVPLVTAKIVKNGTINGYTEYIAEEDYDKWMVRGFPKVGDVILTTEAPLGEVALLKEEKVALAQRIVCLRGKDNVLDNTYLKYYLQSGKGQKSLSARESGTTVTGIKQAELRRVDIEYPAYDDQRRIASILSSLDRKIELNNKINADLEEMAQAIFKNWFVDFEPFKDGKFVDSELGMIPEGWKVGTLDEIFSLKYGKNLSTSMILEKGDYPVYGANGIIGYYNEYNCDKYSVLVTSRGNGSGDVSRTHHPKSFITNNSFVVEPLEQYKYIELPFINGLFNIIDFKSYCSGSAQPQLTNKAMRNICIISPPMEIVIKYCEMLETLFSHIECVIAENSRLSTLRDTLLPRLMSGELEVPE
jgi:type I restriction enzyme S subunit